MGPISPPLPLSHLASLAQTLPGVGYWSYDATQDAFVWSDQMYEIYGRDRALGPPTKEEIENLVHPDDRPAIVHHHRTYVGRQAPELLVRIVRPDGEVRHVIARNRVEYDDDGALIARYGTLVDVTDIKRAEAAARESEERYRLLAENVPDMISRTSITGEVLYVSAASRHVFGTTPEEHKHLKPADLVHPDDFDRVIEAIGRLIHGGMTQLPEPLVYRARRKDGRWIWIEANPQLIRDGQGNPVEFIDVVRDVSETKRIEAELREARVRAEAAASAKAAFLANMSHELRTPLTSIVGFSQLLGSRADLPEEAQRYARRIAEASEALLAIINDVLDISKLDAGHVELEYVPVAVAALVEETMGLVSLQAGAKGLTLQARHDPALPRFVATDPARLRQVLLNYLANAVKFTEQGGITVTTSYAQGRLKIAVQDTGPGISDEARERLFERFSQADASISRTHGGTGLGLAICRSLAELMGGSAGVDTSHGKGSTFFIEIPAKAAADPAGTTASTEPQAVDALRILVADDTAMNRELVRAMLSASDCIIDEAAGGAEAIAAADNGRFDLILMDVRMPRVDGLAATRTIRAGGGPNRDTPILALTADVAANAAEACRAAGMDDVVAKPIVMSQLRAKIAEWGRPDSARKAAAAG